MPSNACSNTKNDASMLRVYVDMDVNKQFAIWINPLQAKSLEPYDGTVSSTFFSTEDSEKFVGQAMDFEITLGSLLVIFEWQQNEALGRTKILMT